MQEPGKLRAHRENPASVSHRPWGDVGLGLLVVCIVILVSHLLVRFLHAERADTPVFRRSVELTINAADQQTAPANPALQTWREFLTTPRGQKLPTAPAHRFVDSFLVAYQDGILDSLETSRLAGLLASFAPTVR